MLQRSFLRRDVVVTGLEEIYLLLFALFFARILSRGCGS